MIDLVLSAHRLDDLRDEGLSWAQDSSISGKTKLDSLAEDRHHSTNKNRYNSEQLHLQRGLKIEREITINLLLR
jgi:hypothetical protein